MGSPHRIEVAISFSDMLHAASLTERVIQRLRDAGVPLRESANPKSRITDMLVRGTLERMECGAMNEHLIYVWTDTEGPRRISSTINPAPNCCSLYIVPVLEISQGF